MDDQCGCSVFLGLFNRAYMWPIGLPIWPIRVRIGTPKHRRHTGTVANVGRPQFFPARLHSPTLVSCLPRAIPPLPARDSLSLVSYSPPSCAIPLPRTLFSSLVNCEANGALCQVKWPWSS